MLFTLYVCTGDSTSFAVLTHQALRSLLDRTLSSLAIHVFVCYYHVYLRQSHARAFILAERSLVSDMTLL